MRAILRLTARFLLRKPIRTLLTLLCITLSVALVGTVCAFSSAMMEIVGQNAPESGDVSAMEGGDGAVDVASLADVASVTDETGTPGTPGTPIESGGMDPGAAVGYAFYAALFWGLALLSAIFAAVMIGFALSLRMEDKVAAVGALRALGAGKGQLLLFLLPEPILFVLIGLPGGFLLGLNLGVPVLDTFLAVFGGADAGAGASSAARPGWIAAAAVLSLAAIALAAIFPLRRILRLSIPDALSGGKVRIHVDLRKRLFTRVLERLFGRMGLLAGQNCVNHRTRLRGIAWSLSGAGIFTCALYGLWLYVCQEPRGGTDLALLDTLNRASGRLAIPILALTTVCAVSVTQISLRSRRAEFATLSAIGLTRANLGQMLALEMVYIGFYTLLYTAVGSLIVGGAEYFLLSQAAGYDLRFAFPLSRVGLALLYGLLLCLILTLISLAGIRSADLAQIMRDE